MPSSALAAISIIKHSENAEGDLQRRDNCHVVGFVERATCHLSCVSQLFRLMAS